MSVANALKATLTRPIMAGFLMLHAWGVGGQNTAPMTGE